MSQASVELIERCRRHFRSFRILRLYVDLSLAEEDLLNCLAVSVV